MGLHKHGCSKRGAHTPEFRSWMAMRGRCERRSHGSWHKYGGKGIKVCERWKDFLLFLADMGPKPSEAHTIDRRDGTKGYEPGNCRWATSSEQSINRHTTKWVTVGGETLAVSQWALRMGVSKDVIYDRLKLGWEPTRAVLAPLGSKRLEKA